MAELVVFLRSREIARVPIMMAEMTIGRDRSADVVIDNVGVSRTHAIVTCRDGVFRVRDAKSENGITVNGTSVREAELSYGDIIGINKYKIHFSEQGGVPAEMLMPPTKQIGNSPGNVVATMTVDAEAARRIQDQFIARKLAARVAPVTRKRAKLRTLNLVLALALLGTLLAIGMRLALTGRLPW